MENKPFYDPARTYEENYAEGPFGVFSDRQALAANPQVAEPRFEFLGHPVGIPFGIPAGPLVNSRFMESAFRMGFDIAVYKTVRSVPRECHPFPNVLAVHVPGQLTHATSRSTSLIADADFSGPLSITNSFGVPSKEPRAWQEDFTHALKSAGSNQIAVLSFMGTVRPGEGRSAFVEDFAKTAALAVEAGAEFLEIDLSCPNVGAGELVCYDLEITADICAAVRSTIGSRRLLLKVGYYPDDESLERLAEVAERYADGIAGINALQGTIVDRSGAPALPGAGRERSGVCGASIREAGIDMVKRLAAVRVRRGSRFTIVGVGGVMTPEDFLSYRSAGADAVMSATGAMWDPYLAQKIRRMLYN